MLGGLAQVVIAVRILGPEGYGALAVIVAATSLIHGLLATPGGDTIITYVSRSIANDRPVEAANIIRFAMATSLGLSVIAYCVLAVLAVGSAGWLDLEPRHVTATLAYGLIGVLLAVQSETFAVLRITERVVGAFWATLGSTVVQIGALLAVWTGNGGLLGVVIAGIAAAATNGFLLFFLAALSARRLGTRGLFASASVRVSGDVVRFHVGMFGTSTVTHLTANIDVLLIAHFAGATETGLYRAARQLADTARAPFAPLGRSLQAEFSKLWFSFDGTALRRTARRYSILIASGALAVFGTLAILSDTLVGTVYGPAFAPVVPLLMTMIPGAFVIACFVGVSTLPHATGRVRPLFYAHTAALATSSLTLLALVPTYGAVGGAWAFVVFAVTWAVVLSPHVVATLKRSYDLRPEPSNDSDGGLSA